MKYIITTLGCKVNQYETQAIETILRRHGHIAAKPGEQADAVMINTCAVTAESGRKSRQTIRRLHSENPGAVLAVCGCYSQIEPDIAARIGAKVIFGAADREKFIEAVESAVARGEALRSIDKPFERRFIERLPAGAVEGRTRAMLKIQDGCVNFCSYCIIPYTRGRLRSLPIEEAAAEAARIAGEGFRELVLTGIEVASYGLDFQEKPGLADVICACAQAAPSLRLRLGSLEPTVITEELCRRLRDCGRVCRHFHLSLQSGCDRTLKNMNRKYDTADFFRRTELLREYFPGCGLTCDVIVGFPGETEEDHRESLAFIEKCGFSQMHIFPYSRRPGTPADAMPDQCSNGVKERRAAETAELAERLRRQFMESCVGLTLPVLFETEEDGLCCGHSDSYVPVKVPGAGLRGRVEQVLIESLMEDELAGRLT